MALQRILVLGATGMVGGLVLRECLRRPEVGAVTTIGRRPTGLRDPKLTEVLHRDFADYREVAGALADQDVAFFCLGVYTGTVSDDELRRVTVDYAAAFAEALHARSPRAALCFLSGQGADPSETSRIAFARYKGAAENALQRIGFPRLHIFRPGYIYPVERREEPHLGYRVMRLLYPGLRVLFPNRVIRSDDLARAMVHAGLHGTGDHADPVLEHRDARDLAATAGQ